jgi:hypothetical protein
MGSNKNIIKVKIMWKVSCAGRGDGYKTTVTNNNTGGRMNRGRCSGIKITSIGGDMIGSTSVKIPVMLRGLLKLKSLKLGCQGLLVPIVVVKVGRW